MDNTRERTVRDRQSLLEPCTRTTGHARVLGPGAVMHQGCPTVAGAGRAGRGLPSPSAIAANPDLVKTSAADENLPSPWSVFPEPIGQHDHQVEERADDTHTDSQPVHLP